jgi:hypothetical protein
MNVLRYFVIHERSIKDDTYYDRFSDLFKSKSMTIRCFMKWSHDYIFNPVYKQILEQKEKIS